MNKFLMSMLISVLLFSTPALAQVRELASPAGTGSGQPNLTVAPDGRVYLSWIERLGEGRFSLRFSTLEKEKWSAPQVIAEGSNWFVNWADFPSLIVLPDGSLAAHWLVKSGSGTFDYDVTISRSFDGGKTWGKPFVPHRDGVKAEHGFVSLFATKEGQLAAVWLDGREMTSGSPDGKKDDHGHGHGNMTLRYVTIKRDGTLINETKLDARVCECCQTSAAATDEGAVVVYRDRSDDEMRDISIVRLKNGKWTEPRTVHNDGWKLNGCPVNGPSVAAAGKRVAVAWFTAANDKPQVNLAFSTDSGESFGKPMKIDDGNPVGRVETLLLPDGSALVCWLEKATGSGSVRVRRIYPDGKMDASIAVAANGTARSNGFPQMVRSGNTLVFSWVSSRVLTATMTLPSASQLVQPASTQVRLFRAPNGGLQPQAAMDERGTLHLIYLTGDPAASDVFYVRRAKGQTGFSTPLRVNSQPGSAVATGTIRGAQLALGKNARLHVIWNGSNTAVPRPSSNSAPLLYTRLNDAGTAFEAQRNLIHATQHLDGGGSVAADKAGNVYAIWHAAGEKTGEPHRRIWLAASTDDGKTFGREVAIDPVDAGGKTTGVCACCGLRAFINSQGKLFVLYRTATEMTERGMFLLTSADRDKTFTGARLDSWNLTTCPMSSAVMTEAKHTIGAWENNGQVFFTTLGSAAAGVPMAAPGSTGKRKHPAIATNSRGETILVWTEGTGWKKGGSLAWQVFDGKGKPTTEKGTGQDVPVWGLATVVAEADGSFSIVY